MALKRDNKTWALAQILEIRAKPAPNSEDEEEEDQTKKELEEIMQEKCKIANPEAADVEMKNEGGQVAKKEKSEDSDDNLKHANSPVQYYVNYMAEPRRNDRWVEENMIKIDDDKVEIEHIAFVEKEKFEEEERKNQTFLANDEHNAMSEIDLENFIKMTKLKTIEFLQLGETTIETWYHSDFPKEYHCRILYTCPFCLTFFTRKRELETHSERCEVRCPPGDEIYRDREDKLSVFEFDAKQQKNYTENLCYIAKLFLDHKNIQSEIEAFYFYILCEYKEDGYHPVGYFSKEKDSENYLNNLSCIMVLPPWQRCGYGKFIIDFSYQLSKIERK